MMIVPDVSDIVWLLTPGAPQPAGPTPTAAMASSPTSFPTVVPDLPEYQHISRSVGGATLWTGFAAMVFASLVFIALSWRIPVARRLYHINATAVTLISAFAFLAMAMHQGSSMVKLDVVERHDHGLPDIHRTVFRQIFWARHVETLLGSPFMLANIGLASGMSGAHIALASLASVFGNLAGLFASYSNCCAGQKWTWYSVACLSYFTIIYFVGVHGYKSAAAKGQSVSRFFNSFIIYLLVVATAYPVIWSVSAGTRQISVNTEVVLYTIADFFGKFVSNAWLVWAASRIDDLGIELPGFWADGSKIASHGRIRVGEDTEASG